MPGPEQSADRRERVSRFAQSERTHWTSNYADAVRDVTKIKGWTFPRDRDDLLTLSDLIAAHCEDLDTVSVCAWISETVKAFAEHVVGLKEHPKLWSNYGPKGLLRWHNEDLAVPAARPALAKASAHAANDFGDEGGAETSCAESAAAMGELLAQIGAVGRGGAGGR